MSEETTVRVSVMDENDDLLSEVAVTIPKEEVIAFINSFENHFIGSYDDSEIM